MMPTTPLTSVAAAIVNTPIDLTHFIGDRTGASYTIATFVMSVVDWLLGIFGLEHNQTIVTILYAAVVLVLSLVVGYVVQVIIFSVTRFIAQRWNNHIYSSLHQQKFFYKICRIIPAIVFLILIQFTLSNHNALSGIFTKITLIVVTIYSAIAINAMVMSLWQLFDERENKRKLPLRGLCELIKGMIWIIAAIIIVCVIIDKSPAALLAGLGAFAAVLMLIFKDSILGLVAGVQLSENDSLHVGDWIKVNGTDANGTVAEVTLTSVKVINWDKTTTNLPPYSLVSGSFTNYRSMQQSGTRRIQRSYNIDADSVLPCTPQMLENFKKIPLMEHWITVKMQQQAEGKTADYDNPAGLVDGSIDTNLGCFRAYMKMWLDANPDISHTSDCFISTLAQTPNGIPLQVYCFTATSKWFPYEAIQDTVFEHLASMLRFFQLYSFENPSSRDTLTSGWISGPASSASIDNVFGIPYPFFQPIDTPDSPRSTRPAPQSAPKEAST